MTTLTVLGSGTAVPTARRSPPGLLLQRPGGDSFLIDPGPGALCRAVRAGAAIERIAAVFLTHFHPDHTLDLMSLLFARRNVLLEPKLRELTLVGPPGTAALYRRMVDLYGHWVEAPEGRLRLIEIEESDRPLPEAAQLPGRAVEVAHMDHSLGYRFELPEGTIAISGDSEPCAGLIRLGYRADLFLLECSVSDAHRGTPGHLCPSEVAAIAIDAEPARLVLYHLYPPVDASAALRIIETRFRGRTVVAEDGQTWRL